MHRLDYVVAKLTEQHPEEIVRASYLNPQVLPCVFNGYWSLWFLSQDFIYIIETQLASFYENYDSDQTKSYIQNVGMQVSHMDYKLCK